MVLIRLGIAQDQFRKKNKDRLGKVLCKEIEKQMREAESESREYWSIRIARVRSWRECIKRKQRLSKFKTDKKR